jgi:hypothetical protein
MKLTALADVTAYRMHVPRWAGYGLSSESLSSMDAAGVEAFECINDSRRDFGNFWS